MIIHFKDLLEKIKFIIQKSILPLAQILENVKKHNTL